jgi:signal transduction histidine kinase
MRGWLRGKPGGLAAFAVIAALVAGGLGWVTAAALRLEREQLQQRAEAEQADRLRLALWRLDGLISPHLAREDSRPFNHYSAVFAPPVALKAGLTACWPAGAVMEPSPLLSAELPPWMSLHFQADARTGWASPQVLPPQMARRLQEHGVSLPGPKITRLRRDLLDRLRADLPAGELLAAVRSRARPPTVHDTTLLVLPPDNRRSAQAAAPVRQQAEAEYQTRSNVQAQVLNEKKAQTMNRDLALNNTAANGANWMQFAPGDRVQGIEAVVTLSPMVPLWLTPHSGADRLLLARLVRVEDREICQGIVLDGPALAPQLVDEVSDLFPSARLVPTREPTPSQPERTMAALPFVLDPSEVMPAAVPVDWTPLRVGLVLAWAAAGVALLAVALGGWSLLDLSERRIRFVSAVTHELRTPLTTLRLYLDMLLGGLVRDEPRRSEYLQTLHGEAERLSRLVGNVLDFSRLERQQPRLVRTHLGVGELFARLQDDWAGRCKEAGKELVFEDATGEAAAVEADAAILQQVLGNLIDNACKYSRDAQDRRVWLRARREGRHVVFEVEDRGPGVPSRERRSIFRAFRRGRSADVTAGGVGLGLALAGQWARLLGGRLVLADAPAAGGACFRVTLPAARGSGGQA